MTRYSDAALLKGDYSHLALQAKDRPMPDVNTKIDWKQAACDNKAEEAAQEIAKHIFAFNQSLDEQKEQLEILTLCALGQMKVLAIVPGDEGDLLRVDGILLPEEEAVSVVIHAAQLSLTFIRTPLKDELEETNSSAKIGFIIYDDLKDRRKARYKKASAAKRAAARKKKAPSMAELRAKAKQAAAKSPAKKSTTPKKSGTKKPGVKK